MKRAALAAAFVVAMTVSAATRSAGAATAEGSAVLLVADPAAPLTLRLSAELRLLGLEVRTRVAAEGAPSRASLETAAREAGALAAVRLVPSERGIEVWIADRITGKTVVREFSRDERSSGGDDGALTVHVVELLRASLLEARTATPSRGETAASPEVMARLAPPAPPPPPATTMTTAASPPPARREPTRATPAASPALWLALEPGIVGSPGGLGPIAALEVSLAWMPTERIGALAFATVPLTRPTFEDGDNRADLAAYLAGAGLRLALGPRGSSWAPSADVGLAMALVVGDGTPAAGFVAKSSSTAAAAPFLGAGVAYAASPRVRLRVDARGALVTRRITLAIAGVEVGRWGAPVAQLEAGLDVALF